MALKLITAPVIEPISLEEARLFLRIDSDPGEEDGLIGSMITAARQEAEKITRRQLITATWELRLDCFSETIYLPMPPLQSVSPISPVTVGGVKYLNTAGVEQILTENTDYLVDIYSEPGRITPAFGQVWPPTYSVPNAVRIVFKAGYGDAATAVPAAIKNWIKAMIGSMWENRETVVISPSTLILVNLGFLDGLLDNYRIFGME